MSARESAIKVTAKTLAEHQPLPHTTDNLTHCTCGDTIPASNYLGETTPTAQHIYQHQAEALTHLTH